MDTYTYSGLPLKERIKEYLKTVPFANTKQIARAVGSDYRSVYYLLSSMFVQGEVETMLKYERFPNSEGGIKVRYWRLVRDED